MLEGLLEDVVGAEVEREWDFTYNEVFDWSNYFSGSQSNQVLLLQRGPAMLICTQRVWNEFQDVEEKSSFH